MMRRRNRNIERSNTRQSVWYHPSEIEAWWPYSKGISTAENMYVHMFLEDVKAGLLPYFREESMVSASPEGSVETIIQALNEDDHSLQRALWHFADKSLIYYLLVYGRACYEIVRYEDGAFTFEDIAPYTLINIFGRYYQYIPKRVSQDRNLPRFQRVATENLFFIRLPNPLSRKIKKLLNILTYLSGHNIMPQFARDDLMKGVSVYNKYNTTWYHKTSQKILAKIAKEIGWDGRRMFKDEALEYYQLVRFLRFERFKYQCRSIIIDGINTGLSKAVADQEKPKIIPNGLPSQDEVDAAIKSLESGDRKFNDVISPFLNFT